MCEAVNNRNKEKEQSEWERMRLLGAIMVQPYAKNKINPKDLLQFPWDEKTNEKTKDIMTPAERRAAAEKFIKDRNKNGR